MPHRRRASCISLWDKDLCAFRYTYDAWNRLTAVHRKTVGQVVQQVAAYAYDGLGRRISKVVTYSGDRNRTEYHRYAGWQLLQIDDASDRPVQQFVWGSQYIDEAICMDVDTDSDGDCTDLADSPAGARRFFYCQDANYNVIALREGATIVERYEYDAYGVCRVYKGWDSVAAGENLAVIGDSLFSNPIRYAGYFWDNETGTCQVRHRVYHPRLQRWGQRDPLEYVDAVSLYSYVHECPTVSLDPFGMSASQPVGGPSTQPEEPPTTRPWQRDNKACCSEAKKKFSDLLNADGTVVCCDGRVVPCSFHDIPSGPPGTKKAHEILDACIMAHEKSHIPDLNTKPCDLDLIAECPGVHLLFTPDEPSRKKSECKAYGVSLSCLAKAYKECRGDQACLAALSEYWEQYAVRYGKECGQRYPNKKPW